MSERGTPAKKESVKQQSSDEDEDDHLWYLHTPEYQDDPADYAFAKEFPATTVLIPALLLCQTGISFCNVICSFAIIKTQTSEETEEFGFVGSTWLVVSAVNALVPLLLLAFFRMESALIMRIYCAASCGTFLLLNISIIQTLLVLVKYYWTADHTGSHRLTVGGILLGVVARIIDIIVTGAAIFAVYQYSQIVDLSERSKKRRQKKKMRQIAANRITVENT